MRDENTLKLMADSAIQFFSWYTEGDDMKTDELSTVLAEAIRTFEEEEMAVRPAQVTVMIGEELVLVHLTGVLSSSERALARTDIGQAVLMRFNTLLFNSGSDPSIKEQVSKALEREVIDVTTSLSPLTGSLIVVFSLGAQLVV